MHTESPTSDLIAPTTLEQEFAVITGDDTSAGSPNDNSEPAYTPEQAEAILRQYKLVVNFQQGTLRFAEFKQLPQQMQRQYVARFGRPKTNDQLRAIAKRQAKRVARNRAQKASRKANRRRQAA
jgi:hypothetical protein